MSQRPGKNSRNRDASAASEVSMRAPHVRKVRDTIRTRRASTRKANFWGVAYAAISSGWGATIRLVLVIFALGVSAALVHYFT